ncbi:hypothetical protein CN220_33480, partial [Sinorhizobium meliloti]
IRKPRHCWKYRCRHSGVSPRRAGQQEICACRSRKAGRRDKRHALSPDELERAPRVSFAPLAGRRCRQADEGLSRGRSLFQ